MKYVDARGVVYRASPARQSRALITVGESELVDLIDPKLERFERS